MEKEELHNIYAVAQQVNASLHDLVLVSFVMAYTTWAKSEELYTEIELSGRNSSTMGLDISRTIGWCNTMFPLLIHRKEDWRETLCALQKTLRQIPNEGISYGISRYLTKDIPEINNALQPQIKFLYHGQLAESMSQNSSVFTMTTDNVGSMYGEQNVEKYQLYSYGYLLNGALHLKLTFSENIHRQSSIENLLQSYLKSIREIC